MAMGMQLKSPQGPRRAQISQERVVQKICHVIGASLLPLSSLL